jgi:competence protein ComEC
MTLVARRLADVPGGQLGWPGGAWGAASLAAVTAVVVLAGPSALRRARRRPWVTAACAALVAALLVPVLGARPSWPPAGWVAVACDVGQGDALVLRGEQGRTVLVDAGPSPDDVDACLSRLGVTTLDAVVLTHFHADHVDGLPGVLDGRRVGAVLVTITDDPPEGAAAVRSWAAQAGVPVRATRAGERVELGDLAFDVLWPERVLQDGSVPNNASIVMDVQVAGVRLLLTGDIEPAAARVIAQRARLRDPAVDVLKVAHHGSAKQDPALVAALSPALALISVGADNHYGHPAPSTTRLLDDVGARIARTDLSGDLAVVREPDGVRLVTSGPRRHSATRSTGGGD